jgi:hypothetical protein
MGVVKAPLTLENIKPVYPGAFTDPKERLIIYRLANIQTELLC